MVLLLCTSCGYTKMTYHTDGTVEWQSRTLWKDVKDADIRWTGTWGELDANLGSSEGNGREEIIACLLAPQLCQ